MSAQSVVNNTPYEILSKVDKFYICQGKNYILKYDYDIDKKIDIDKFFLIDWLDRISTSCNKNSGLAINIVKKLL